MAASDRASIARARQFGATALQLRTEDPIEAAADDPRLVAMFRALQQRGPVDLAPLVDAWWEGFEAAAARVSQVRELQA